MKRLSRCLGWATIFVLCLSSNLWADADISVDGDPSDWPSDVFTFYDEGKDMPPPYADIVAVSITNDNTSGDLGNLYLGIEYLSDFRENVGGNDVDVFIRLDIDGDGSTDGPLDRVIEVTSGDVFDGTGTLVGSVGAMVYDGTFMEVSIPYSILGLTHEDDAFGVVTSTSGHPSGTVDSSPPIDPDTGEPVIIEYDGTVGDDVEPLAVRMVQVSAGADRHGVTLRWVTGSERNNVGFYVYRLDETGKAQRLTRQLIPGLVNASMGRAYRFVDPQGQPGDRYWIEDLESTGLSRIHPVTASQLRFNPRLHMPVPTVARHLTQPAISRKTAPTILPKPKTPPALAPAPAAVVKLGLAQEALFRLTESDLIAAGLDTSRLDGGNLALEGKDGPLPVLVHNGAYWFVGRPQKDRYADTDVLLAYAGTPRPMAVRRTSAGCLQEFNLTADWRRLEEDHVYHIARPGADPFYWALAFAGTPASLSFDLPQPGPGAAQLRLAVAGTAPGETMEHQLQVSINGKDLGVVTWLGRDEQELSFGLSGWELREQANVVQLTIPPGQEHDVVFANRVGVQYGRKLKAQGESMIFEARAGRCLRIDGLTDAAPMLIDISDPGQPVRLTGAELSENPDGTFSLRFNDGLLSTGLKGGPHRYLLTTAAAAPTPDALGAWQPVPLANRDLEVDYLIVTHADFMAAAERMGQYHSSQGRKVKIVTTQQIYDSFNLGRPSAGAIRELMQTAKARWQVAPSFVLLLGGATADSNNVLGGGARDWVPAPFWMTHSQGFEAAADVWYVTAEGSVDAWAAIGRLAVRDLAEAEAVVDKILARHQSPPALTGRMLFVADQDQDAPAGTLGSFEFMAESMINTCLPDTLIPDRLYLSSSLQPQDELLAYYAQGLDVVHFMGHAYMEGWSSPPIMTTALAETLSTPSPFLLFSWSCFDGAFTGPWGESLAWAHVANVGGGAVSVLASSSLSDGKAVEMLAELTLCLLTSGTADTVGQALQQAKNLLHGLYPVHEDAVATFNLLGDPAMPNPWQ